MVCWNIEEGEPSADYPAKRYKKGKEAGDDRIPLEDFVTTGSSMYWEEAIILIRRVI